MAGHWRTVKLKMEAVRRIVSMRYACCAVKIGTLAICVGSSTLGLSSAVQAAEPQWHTFEWGEAEVEKGGSLVKAGVFLPIEVNGVECLAQLDTGANGMIIWNKPLDTTLPVEDAVVAIAGQRHVVSASALQLAGSRDGSCKTAAIAVVGNAYFDDGTLTLDLKESRFSFTADALLENEPRAREFQYPLWSGHEGGGHVVVQVGLPNGQAADAILDTGAASFGLSTLTVADWNMLTGDIPLRASATVRTYRVNSWGKQIPCFTTDAPGSIRIGPALSVLHFSVSYCALDSFRPGPKLIGVLGLRHLNDRVITLDYRSRKWLISE